MGFRNWHFNQIVNVMHITLNMFTKNKCELDIYNVWLTTYKLTQYKWDQTECK